MDIIFGHHYQIIAVLRFGGILGPDRDDHSRPPVSYFDLIHVSKQLKRWDSSANGDPPYTIGLHK
jgi:hypothetical protein